MDYLLSNVASFGFGVFMTLMCVLPAGYVLTSYLLRKQQDDLVWRFTSESQRHEDRYYREKADLKQRYQAEQENLMRKVTSESQRHEDRHYREKVALRKYYEDLLASERLAALVQKIALE
jgi:hypothetical protein